ncbi:MAG: CapA family protein [Lachnospiraceae bacterium]|nr:CapA family protein [Lachnospiraceae bacterium]MCM1241119.1 CapA family protein [Lachnospiraceae bacterium]
MKTGTFIRTFLLLPLTLACVLSVPIMISENKNSDQTPVLSSKTSEDPDPERLTAPESAQAEESVPTPTPEPVFEEFDITLMALGDNLMHMGIVRTGQMEDGTYDYSFLFQGMEEYLAAADISIINQETIFGGNQLGFSGYPHFNSPSQVGDAIAAAGFNVVLHATNHAADQGIDGIYNCVSFWETHPEILMTGICGETPEDTIPLLNIRGVTFAILNYTYGPNLGTLPSELKGHLDMLCAYNETTGAIDFTSLNPQVLEDIRNAEELADIIIVCPHWGTEYQAKPSSYQETFAEQMTEAGADLIIGTHPHVPQPVEWITSENGNTALCYYSLGNYVSTQKQALCMLEEMAWVTFHVTEDEVLLSEEKTGVLPLVCHYRSGPVRLEKVYLLEDYTEELAAAHGIRNYGGVILRLEDLQDWSRDIFGSFILQKSDIRSGRADNSSQ